MDLPSRAVTSNTITTAKSLQTKRMLSPSSLNHEMMGTASQRLDMRTPFPIVRLSTPVQASAFAPPSLMAAARKGTTRARLLLAPPDSDLPELTANQRAQTTESSESCAVVVWCHGVAQSRGHETFCAIPVGGSPAPHERPAVLSAVSCRPYRDSLARRKIEHCVFPNRTTRQL